MIGKRTSGNRTVLSSLRRLDVPKVNRWSFISVTLLSPSLDSLSVLLETRETFLRQNHSLDYRVRIGDPHTVQVVVLAYRTSGVIIVIVVITVNDGEEPGVRNLCNNVKLRV